MNILRKFIKLQREELNMALFTRMCASFNENMRKVEASKRSGAGTSEVSFRYFIKMQFLITTNESRKGVSSATMFSKK